ncbi:uncharacterized protein LOC112053624 [Bicyclus anynana]|uniref:Uncharacterized protein LOC112053624 n=1 Tax=Bicyclus anynana TaxID=110368 RepID=A0A6J1NPQ8_BICAN|nr:uncharacterized protein LOC112053624 [Bicyclus anynana]
MPNSFNCAMTRLKGIERKMNASEGFAERYRERINHLFQNEFAGEVIDLSPSPRTWYLPHFGVDNPHKQKLRLVFDAAAKCHNLSLNDYLLTGPDLLVSLLGIMMRFREHKIGIMGDIKDMFLRIKILPEDQDALRFLWRDNPKKKLKICAMTSLIFGANCSPFIAQFIKNKNAQMFESSKPAAVSAIRLQHYMDDYIDSIENIETSKKLIEDITYIHKQGGFEIRNWASNCDNVLKVIPTEALGPSAIKLNIEQHSERTLGLMWSPNIDTLGFDVSFKRIPSDILSGKKIPTKREILRVIMSIFDVFGFLAPFTIKGKLILQETWRSGIEWDEPLNSELYSKWTEWLTLLKGINKIYLPRHYQAAARASEMENAMYVAPNSASDYNAYSKLELHVFTDASIKAMCAVAYWRWEENKIIRVAFIASKCKVAPVKQLMSVPRLELQAAVIGARLAETIIKQHRIKPHRKYFWSDSTTVLHWVKNSARNYKMFVAHRLGEIDELTRASEWRYIPTKLNVADAATREVCDMTLFSGAWLYGPTFLCCDADEWPEDMTGTETEQIITECVNTIIIENKFTCLPACPDPARFSSWLRLLKSTCMVLAFVDKVCKKLTGEVDGAMMARAERLLMLYAQAQSFAEDLEHLKNQNILDKKSKLLTLTPFLDEQGILRVGGRIDAATGIPREVKHPIILDGRHPIARLIVMHYHKKFAHGNHETIVNELKQRYWITRLRPTVRTVASKCMLCRIRKAQPQPPRMGDLPEARLAHHQRPFTFCGLDLFGPMKITVGRRHQIRYGVLFTCMTIRAIHIEIVHTLTTDSLIMALRRMAARKSWPLRLFSDNGTNLRGADTELRKSIEDLDQEVLKREAVNYGTTWTFIPPRSPHWGGAWERLIKSVKTALKVVLTEQAPKEEVLLTLMAEVEQIVNSRPLTHVSVEPASAEAITPNHFLIGTSSNLPVLGEFNDSGRFLRRQWRTSQLLADCFWRRWVKEVLPQMLPRTKWLGESQPVQVGDLVVIADPNMPRGVWPRGIVEAVLPGKDGRVRVVDVRTKSGLLRRPVARVAVLPVKSEC